MVVSLGPGKFYGSSLPRPRFYDDVKLNSHRIDPPVPVNDPLLSWAQEAHWSMGGLSFKRLRFQGRIEGNAERLRKQREQLAKLKSQNGPKNNKKTGSNIKKRSGRGVGGGGSVSPPSAPLVNKRRRFMDLFDEEEEENDEVEEEMEAERKKKRPARKLVGEFDKVANESGVKLGIGTRRRNLEVNDVVGGDVEVKVMKDLNEENFDGGASGRVRRTSPRLAKRKI